MLKLSIIVPVYNVEKYLPKCIDSLICGDGGYEIILVNDGSTDGSPAILADYAARYHHHAERRTWPCTQHRH